MTEIEPGDQFEHQIDKDGTNLEITIKNAKGSRKVYFHLRHGYTRDTPWPIGPVELFDPKPEPIPPAELEALRKAAFLTSETPTTGGCPDKQPGPGVPSEVSSAIMPDAAKGGWFWTGVSLAILVAFVLMWKLHQRDSINRNANGK